MSIQSKTSSLIKEIEHRFQKKPQKKSVEQVENYIKEMCEYVKHNKKESIYSLSKFLKHEVEDYYNKIILDDITSKGGEKELKEIKSCGNKTKDDINSKCYLAHYTNMETIFSIIKNEKQMNGLRLSDISYSNDPSEGNYLKNNLIKYYPWLKYAIQETDAFVCSFFSGGDDIGDKITYWQSYGKDGLGCSIQFKKSLIEKKTTPVLYGETLCEILRNKFKCYFELGGLLYNGISSDSDKKYFASQFWKALDKVKFLYKHKGFEYEQEYRFIKISESEEVKEDFKSKPPYLRRYIFDDQLNSENILKSGSKITIGPRVTNSSRLCKYFKKVADQSKFYGPQFICSKIPYRKIW